MEKNTEGRYYDITIAGCKRSLPIVNISDELAIGCFIILGDIELTARAAEALAGKIPEADVLVSAEAKGIPLVHEMARVLGMEKAVIARKSLKSYMIDPIMTEVDSITTPGRQRLYLGRSDYELLKGKRVVIVDDVISTGESLKSIEYLVDKAGGIVVGKAAILAEGAAAERDDIIYLEPLPLFAAE